MNIVDSYYSRQSIKVVNQIVSDVSANLIQLNKLKLHGLMVRLSQFDKLTALSKVEGLTILSVSKDARGIFPFTSAERSLAEAECASLSLPTARPRRHLTAPPPYGWGILRRRVKLLSIDLKFDVLGNGSLLGVGKLVLSRVYCVVSGVKTQYSILNTQYALVLYLPSCPATPPP